MLNKQNVNRNIFIVTCLLCSKGFFEDLKERRKSMSCTSQLMPILKRVSFYLYKVIESLQMTKTCTKHECHNLRPYSLNQHPLLDGGYICTNYASITNIIFT